MNFCPQCGAKTNTPNDRFCANCGAILSENSTQQPSPAGPSATAPPHKAPEPIPFPAAPPAQNESVFVADFIVPEKEEILPAGVQDNQALANDLLASISRSTGKSMAPDPSAPPFNLFEQNARPSKNSSELDQTQVFSRSSLHSGDKGDLPGEAPAPSAGLEEEFPPIAYKKTAREPLPEQAKPSSDFVFAAEEAKAPLDHSLEGTEPEDHLRAIFDILQSENNLAALMGAENSPVSEPVPGAVEKLSPPPAASEPGLFDKTQEIPVPLAAQEAAPPLGNSADDKRARVSKLAESLLEEDLPAETAPPKNLFTPEQQNSQGDLKSLLMEKEEPKKTLPPPPPLPPLPPTPRQRKDAEEGEGGGSSGKGVKIAIGAVLFVLFAFAATLGMLYWTSRPDKTIDQFLSDLQSSNYASLNASVEVSGFAPTPEGWDALSAAFAAQEQAAELKQELLRPATEARHFTAISVKKEPLFLFINRHSIQIFAVEVLAPGAPDGSQLLLGANSYSGRSTIDGVLFSGIMPGTYQASLVTVNPGGNQITSPSFTLDALEVSAPNVAPASFGYTITLQNILSDDASIFVDSFQVPQVATGGTAILPDVNLGSTISVLVVQDGVTKQASVVFDNPAVTTLTLGEYQTIDAPPESTPASESSASATLTAEEINNIISTFYASYLNAINEQSTASLALSSPLNTKDVEARIKKPANKDNLFTFVSAKCEEKSIVSGTEKDIPTITFNATFGFSYKPRDGSGEAKNSSNRQTVQLIQQDGQWVVNRFTFVEDKDFEANNLAKFK